MNTLEKAAAYEAAKVLLGGLRDAASPGTAERRALEAAFAGLVAGRYYAAGQKTEGDAAMRRLSPSGRTRT